MRVRFHQPRCCGSRPAVTKRKPLRSRRAAWLISTTNSGPRSRRSRSTRRSGRCRWRFRIPIRFDQDTTHASYDPVYANRFWRALSTVDALCKQFRARFIGKCSPVHFFWGSFDLAVTRFSGRRAPERPGADAMTREAYSHEVSSVGWWPGSGGFDAPMFYAYAAPEPPVFARVRRCLLKHSTARSSANSFFPTTWCVTPRIPRAPCWTSFRRRMKPRRSTGTGTARRSRDNRNRAPCGQRCTLPTGSETRIAP